MHVEIEFTEKWKVSGKSPDRRFRVGDAHGMLIVRNEGHKHTYRAILAGWWTEGSVYTTNLGVARAWATRRLKFRLAWFLGRVTEYATM